MLLELVGSRGKEKPANLTDNGSRTFQLGNDFSHAGRFGLLFKVGRGMHCEQKERGRWQELFKRTHCFKFVRQVLNQIDVNRESPVPVLPPRFVPSRSSPCPSGQGRRFCVETNVFLV